MNERLSNFYYALVCALLVSLFLISMYTWLGATFSSYEVAVQLLGVGVILGMGLSEYTYYNQERKEGKGDV
jgi:hypothetical protein